MVKANLLQSFRDELIKLNDLFLLNSFQDHITTLSRYTVAYNNQIQTGINNTSRKPVSYVKINPINLSAHLLLALFLYCYLLWVALELLQPPVETGHIFSMKNFGILLLALIVIQIFYGGLMAGNKAALFYPTFPKTGSGYIPHGILKLHPWPSNLIENIAMIQVIHRALGFLVAGCIFYFYRLCSLQPATPFFRKLLVTLPVLVIIQVLLGILTLINSLGKIPVTYGVLFDPCRHARGG